MRTPEQRLGCAHNEEVQEGRHTQPSSLGLSTNFTKRRTIDLLVNKKALHDEGRINNAV
ncbi:hypothetical protein HPQ32_16675 [Photobacterium carnosum]|nr:hypothetical protein [Photobacterium carnosum]MBY3790047.1 hypothetical protein [Photobacterium carnosum]MCD9535656.1 hypothetical protein [Photobacterium carnosum]